MSGARTGGGPGPVGGVDGFTDQQGWPVKRFTVTVLAPPTTAAPVFTSPVSPTPVTIVIGQTFSLTAVVRNDGAASDDGRIVFGFPSFTAAGDAQHVGRDVLKLFFGIEIEHPPFLDVLLPAGISFYTFAALSYTIDIYRRKLEPTRSLLQFGLYITYFPHLVAGPILRASQFLPQLQRKITLRDEQVTQGLFLIATGMVKKVLVADYLCVNLVDRAFDQPELYSAAEVVIALYGFTMQIYCDFSGYTDVARGSAKLMGLELPENFDRPVPLTPAGPVRKESRTAADQAHCRGLVIPRLV